MGSVKPVITVERHDPKKRNTMRMASKAPSTSVFCTSINEARIDLELSATSIIFTPAGISFNSSSITSCDLSTTSMVLAPDDLMTSTETARSPLIMADDTSSCSPSTTSATCSRYTGPAARCATIRRRKSFGLAMRPLIWTICSTLFRVREPAGSS